MQQKNFPVAYTDILDRISNIHPAEYGKSRNYIDGAVTCLSPYISRGVISTRQVMETILQKGYSYDQTESLIKELAWREYFQRTWQWLEDEIFNDIRKVNTGVKNRFLPTAILNAQTGIEAIDKAIRDLFATGYMHNHLRMYVAGLTCNMAKSYWPLPSQWMYYHLLDGDLASNTCSWQWVAGSFSNKQYFFNQENVNKFTHSRQKGSFLDRTYEEIAIMDIPAELQPLTTISLSTTLPVKKVPFGDHSKPLLIYNSYNLDPMWRKEEEANRILLLEPSHFKQFPVSEKVIDFILDLSANIPGIQIFTGEVNEIPGLTKYVAIYSKEHPVFKHYPGQKDMRDWLFPEVNGYYPSFFSYWRNCEQFLKQGAASQQQLLRA